MTGIKRFSFVFAMLIGIGIGCVAATVMPAQQATAQPAPGSWACFAVDQLADPNSASQWRGAQAATYGLNQVARHVATGTIMATAWNEATSIVCVKY